MKLLALDTSSKLCSVALMLGDKIYFESELAERQHAQYILPMINKLLIQQNVQLQELDGIAFGCGPGSFTGIRLAASVVQGLAFGANLPVVPVSDLRALAQSAFRKFKATSVVPVINAYGGSVYWGVYELDESNIVSSVTADQKSLPSEVILSNGSFVGVGDGWTLLPHSLANIIHPDYFPEAQDIAQIASMQFSQGKYVSPENASPVYLHDADAWKKII